MNHEQFAKACNLIVGNERERKTIGTFGEKTLHAVLKYTIEPDETKHEIKIGSYFADIQNENGIIEIQTRSFNALRKKLACFLESGPVTVVYPIAHQKWLVWLDGETGETTKKRKSPKIGTPYEVFYELYRIKPLLTHPNFRLSLVFLDIIEYRNLDGWSADKKKGSSRYERIPQALSNEIHLYSTADYQKLIPPTLPAQFTSKDFQRHAKLNLSRAQTALNVLKAVGAVMQTGKRGNAFIYERT